MPQIRVAPRPQSGPGDPRLRFRWRDALVGRRFALLAAVIVLLGTVPQLFARPIPDVSWLLYAAERILDGAHPYVDVVEVNPPLIVWLNVAVAAIGRALGAPPVLIYRFAVIGGAVLSAILCARVLRHLLGLDPGRLARWIVLLFLFAALPMVRTDFGEREHLLVLLASPYVLAAAARSRGVAMPAFELAVVGLLAGIGVAVKPYFVLLPLALECFLALRARSFRAWLRPEPMAMLIVGLTYLAAVFLLTPQYLDLTRLMGELYAGYLRGPAWLTALLGEGVGLPLFALLAFAALRRRATHPELWDILAIAVVALLASALIQGKGWRYHFYPSMAYGVMLSGLILQDAQRPLSRLAEQVYAAACAAALVTIVLITAAACVRQSAAPHDTRYDADPNYAELRRLIRSQAPGGTVLVLSSNMASAFPLVPNSGARWASRFPSVWLLPALYMDQLRSDAPLVFRTPSEMGPAERYLNDAVAEDLSRFRPDLLVVLRAGPDRREMGIRRLDYLAYFSRDSRIAPSISEYGWLADVDEYRVYHRGRAVGMAEPSAAAAATDVAVSAGWDGLRGVRLDPGVLVGLLIFVPLFAVALRRERHLAS
jgi:hypothetical protein